MSPADPDEEDRRRRWVHEAALVIVLAIAGVVIATLSRGHTAPDAIAGGLFGIAGVAAISFVFYEIGRSEDLDRARGGRGPYDGAPAEPVADEHEHAREPAAPARGRARSRPRRGEHRRR